MKKMDNKVLQFVYALESGGIETFVTNLNGCQEVFERPFDYLLFTAEEHEDFYEEVNRQLGSQIYKVGSHCSKNFVISCIQKRYRSYKIMKQSKYAVVHIHGSDVFCIIEALLAKMAGVEKVIVHSHNTQLGKTSIKNVIKYLFQIFGKLFWKFVADEFCACSTEAAVWMYGKKIVHSGKVHILKNGIVGKQFYFNQDIRNEYRKKLNWEDKYIIGHVGRFNMQKNHTFLIDIFKSIYEKEPSSRLLLFGVGELQGEMKEKAKQLGLTDVVRFYGRSQEICHWLQAMDLYLFPSLYEGLPVSGIEAQASGVPILASDTISPEMKITDCVTWMSLEECPEKWADKAVDLMKTKIENRDIFAEIQKAGYDIEATARELYQLYSC